ncbi:MAG: Asp-tRNA(Asn)/Glu-tRNA(Gln) amidotransferase subunit GatA [Actinobacteria bacterium]|nr:Asp-tRNA(Asn)/Glu-tRNA(Gln) amidotransferase subunit GatA [Actinomycetota bacterium]MCL6104987.1 Asp-tRNA(Asn)/Glu-tRNA(Gln) amidotransferase subunit GatA [Actinomycetota bacterium]
MGARALAGRIRSGEVSALEVIDNCLAEISKRDSTIHAFVHVAYEKAREEAKEIDAKIAAGEDPGVLAGVPVALKDNLCTKAAPTTCSSKILENWVPPYDATVVTKLKAAGAVIVGKTNMDEFAMGSSTEHSAFGPTLNPRDTSRVPGGSSGGSASAVADGMVTLALGSDTGGSIRQPASFCGVVGIKPTYGSVSRYGLVAFASSLDQIGPLAGNVDDATMLLEVVSGWDPLDSTSLQRPSFILDSVSREGVKGIKVGILNELVDLVDNEVATQVRKAADLLDSEGAAVEDVSMTSIGWGIPAYYLIASAEASSNLSRYDGVRYGLRVEGANATLMNSFTRAKGFGAEVKRRIMLGTYALSAGYYDAYYAKAQKIRTLIIQDFQRVYERFDALLAPTTPSVAFLLGEKLTDPLAMYLSDICTVPSSLAGHPAMNIPFGTASGGLPVGIQIMAPALGEASMLKVAKTLEQASQGGFQ